LKSVDITQQVKTTEEKGGRRSSPAQLKPEGRLVVNPHAVDVTGDTPKETHRADMVWSRE